MIIVNYHCPIPVNISNIRSFKETRKDIPNIKTYPAVYIPAPIAIVISALFPVSVPEI